MGHSTVLTSVDGFILSKHRVMELKEQLKAVARLSFLPLELAPLVNSLLSDYELFQIYTFDELHKQGWITKDDVLLNPYLDMLSSDSSRRVVKRCGFINTARPVLIEEYYSTLNVDSKSKGRHGPRRCSPTRA